MGRKFAPPQINVRFLCTCGGVGLPVSAESCARTPRGRFGHRQAPKSTSTAIRTLGTIRGTSPGAGKAPGPRGSGLGARTRGLLDFRPAKGPRWTYEALQKVWLEPCLRSEKKRTKKRNGWGGPSTLNASKRFKSGSNLMLGRDMYKCASMPRITCVMHL